MSHLVWLIVGLFFAYWGGWFIFKEPDTGLALINFLWAGIFLWLAIRPYTKIAQQVTRRE